MRAGPVEATAAGNILVQAIADGRFAGLGEAWDYLAAHIPSRTLEPRDGAAWRSVRLPG